MSVMLLLISVSASFSASTVSFKDSFAEKIYTHCEEGETWYETYPTRKLTASFKLDLGSFFPVTKTGNITKQINADTCFEISIGAIGEPFCLEDGGDVKYTAGKTSATVTRQVDIGEYTEKWVTSMTTTVKWTTKNIVTIKMRGMLP